MYSMWKIMYFVNLKPHKYIALHQIHKIMFFLATSYQIKSNQIKSLLLSHHHSTSALVSEMLMSVLQTVQKNNRQFTYGQTVQKKQQTIYIWTDSTKKQQQQQFTYGQTVQKNNNLHMDRQCKKTTSYIWTDSAKKQQQQQFTYGQTVQKNNRQFTYGQTVQKKQQQFTYGQYIFTDCTEDNVQNTHTYTQYT